MGKLTNADIVYITGHKNPDTDSIVSSIAYANLKRALGVNAIPCRLGDVNSETSYILERFGFRAPMLLKDARSQLDEIEMDEPEMISPETTIKEVVTMMKQDNKPVFAVVNHLNQLQGIVTSSNLSDVLLNDVSKSSELLSNTPVEYIAKTLKGKLIHAPKNPHITGENIIITVDQNRLKAIDMTDKIMIVGNDAQMQIDAITRGVGCLIVLWSNTIAPMVIEAAKEYDCAIIMSSYDAMNTARYIFYASPVKDIMTTNMIVFNKAEFVEDVSKKLIKSRYRSYPVVDDSNHIFGFVSRYHLLNATNKKLILVDHNEKRQSVEGIDGAEVIEIVDHHRIGDVSTSKPIMFRNEIVGSTATIVSKMYFENSVEISPKMAGILLGAMISDTLNFRSPTTTPTDLNISKKLAAIAELDINEYATDIFMVSNTLKGKSMLDIIKHDSKDFIIAGKRIVVSQYILYQLNEIASIEEELAVAMQDFVKINKPHLLVMVFTSIHDNGSVMYAKGEMEDIVSEAFPNKEGEEHTFLDGIVSRKNQIVPKLSLIIHQRV